MLPDVLVGRLRLPILVSPMFLTSGPDLAESSRAGVIGSFPSFNQRTSEGFADWLKDIRGRISQHDAPWAVQYAVHPTNERLARDLALTIEYQVPILISAIGITREVTDAIHAYGGLVFHDAINVRHAKRALDANVDGIIAVSNGAGGHSGTYNPFAFMAELKPILGDKTLILAGCIGDGHSLAGAIAAGADLAYVGTRFINTVESIASEKMKNLILESDITDIIYSDAVDGIGATWLRQTLPSADHKISDKFHVTDVLDHKKWRDILSAGQGVGSIHDIVPTADLIARFKQEYDGAIRRMTEMSRRSVNYSPTCIGKVRPGPLLG